jgi:hypothetical protein
MYARERISTDISRVLYKTFRFGLGKTASHQFLPRRFVEREKKKKKKWQSALSRDRPTSNGRTNGPGIR